MLISRTKTTIDTIIPISFSTKALIEDGLRNPSSVSWAPECFADCFFRSSSWKGTSMIFVPGIFSGRWNGIFLVEVPKVCFFFGGGRRRGKFHDFFLQPIWPAKFYPNIQLLHGSFCTPLIDRLPTKILTDAFFTNKKSQGKNIISRLGVVWHVWHPKFNFFLQFMHPNIRFEELDWQFFWVNLLPGQRLWSRLSFWVFKWACGEVL